MMTYEQAQTATLDELTDELAAAGWDSTQQTTREAREAVYRLLAEYGDNEAIAAIEADQQIQVAYDEEYNAEEFWAALDERFPELAAELREGTATITASQWEAIQQIEGFHSDIAHAPTALVVVDGE